MKQNKFKQEEKLKEFFIENYPDIKLVDYENIKNLLIEDLSSDVNYDYPLEVLHSVETPKKKSRKQRVVLSQEQKKQLYEDYSELRRKYGIVKCRNKLARKYNVSYATARNIIKNFEY